MEIRKEIIKLVDAIKCMPIPVEGKTNLYVDLKVSSLSFIVFLLKIEKRYTITFDIADMEKCLQVDDLVALVEHKVKEKCDKYD